MKIVHYQHCKSLDGWQPVMVRSHTTADRYLVIVNPWGEEGADICECPGYVYRGHCRHQPIARETVCGWSELVSKEEQTPIQRELKQCPRCSRSTSWQIEMEPDEPV